MTITTEREKTKIGNGTKLLAAISKSDLPIISIHDRPEKTTLGRYIYLIECESGSYEAYQKISALPEFRFRYFGAFPIR